MSSLRKSVKGLSALLASLSLLGSGSASFAAGRKNAKVGHGGKPRGLDVKKGANQGEGKDRGKDKDENRKGGKDKVNDLSAAPAAGGSSKPSSMFGEVFDLAKKTGASFLGMSALAKIFGVELISVMSTGQGLIERFIEYLEGAILALFKGRNAWDLTKRDQFPNTRGEDFPELISNMHAGWFYFDGPYFAPIRPLINLFIWGKNALFIDRVLAFLAGAHNWNKKGYLEYTLREPGDLSLSRGIVLAWKPTFFNKRIYQLGKWYGERRAKKGGKIALMEELPDVTPEITVIEKKKDNTPGN